MIDFEKLQRYKESLTFPRDRENIENWEKKIHESIALAEVAQTPGVKDLLRHLKEKISKCNEVLQNDRDLSAQERDKLFVRKDEQQWLINFFEGPSDIIKEAVNKIKQL